MACGAWVHTSETWSNLIHSFFSIRPIVDLPVLGKVVEFIKGLSWFSSLIRFLFRSWRDGLTAKSTCCTCRGPKCGSQHGLGGSQPSVTSLRWSGAPFWPPRVVHAQSAQTGRCTHKQIKTMSSRTAGSAQPSPVSKNQIKNKEINKQIDKSKKELISFSLLFWMLSLHEVILALRSGWLSWGLFHLCGHGLSSVSKSSLSGVRDGAGHDIRGVTLDKGLDSLGMITLNTFQGVKAVCSLLTGFRS